MGLSLAEYMRRLVARDLGGQRPAAKPSLVFDLGAYGGFDIGRNKDVMIAEAFASGRRKTRRRHRGTSRIADSAWEIGKS